MKTPKLGLDPSLRYDAFMTTEQADIDDMYVSNRGMVGFIKLYPQNAGLCVDGTFDEEAWDVSRHPQTISFRPTRRGYRDAIVTLKQQCAPVDLIDLADDCGYSEFEAKLRKISMPELLGQMQMNIE